MFWLDCCRPLIGLWAAGPLPELRLAVRVEDFYERSDGEIAEDGVAEMAAGVDLVVVSASDFRASDVSVGDEVGEDPLRGSFGDSDLLGDVACPGFRVTCDAEKHVRVVSQEHPGTGGPGFALRGLFLNFVALV